MQHFHVAYHIFRSICDITQSSVLSLMTWFCCNLHDNIVQQRAVCILLVSEKICVHETEKFSSYSQHLYLKIIHVKCLHKINQRSLYWRSVGKRWSCGCPIHQTYKKYPKIWFNLLIIIYTKIYIEANKKESVHNIPLWKVYRDCQGSHLFHQMIFHQ